MGESIKSLLPILITGIFSVLACSGAWQYRLKKLERKYQQEDRGDTVSNKLDIIIESQTTQGKKLDSLSEQLTKTDAVTMAVARDRIYYLCDRAVREKDLNPDTMRDIKSLFTPYTANGGDTLAEEYYERYRRMYESNGGVW